MTSHLTMFSTPVMLTLAKDFGVRQVAGKAVNQPSTQNGLNVKPKLPNGLNIPIIGSSGDNFEDTSIAFDPTNEQYGYAVAIIDVLPPGPATPSQFTGRGRRLSYLPNHQWRNDLDLFRGSAVEFRVQTRVPTLSLDGPPTDSSPTSRTYL